MMKPACIGGVAALLLSAPLLFFTLRLGPSDVLPLDADELDPTSAAEHAGLTAAIGDPEGTARSVARQELAFCEVFGSLTSVDGGAVAGAEVVLLKDRWDEVDNAVAKTCSDANGGYRMRLEDGAMWIVARGAGGSRSWTVPVHGRAPLVQIDLALRGRCDAFAIRVVDTAGRGIPESYVYLDFEPEQRRDASGDIAYYDSENREGSTDTEGLLMFEDIEAGNYNLGASAQGRLSAHSWIEIAAAKKQDIEIHLAPSCIVRGVVRWTSGATVPDAHLWVEDAYRVVATAESAEDGSYLLHGFLPGIHRLFAKSGYARVELSETSIRLGETFDWSPVLPEDEEPRQVEWRWWRGCLRDVAGRPLSAWQIRAGFLAHDVYGDSSQTSKTAVSDAEGRFQISIQGEIEELSASVIGPGGLPLVRVLDAVSDDMVISIPLHDLPTASVRGSILGQALSSVRPWRVVMLRDDEPAGEREFNSAEFCFDGLFPGATSFAFYGESSHPVAFAHAELRTGTAVELQPIDVRGLGRIAVFVDDEGFALARGGIWASRNGFNLFLNFARDDSGAYVSDLVCPGSYALCVRLDDRANWNGSALVVEGETTVVHATPKRGIRMHLRVAGLTQKQRRDGTRLEVLDSQRVPLHSLWADAGGTVIVLEPDSYELRVMHSERLLASTWVEVSPLEEGQTEREFVVDVR